MLYNYKLYEFNIWILFKYFYWSNLNNIEHEYVIFYTIIFILKEIIIYDITHNLDEEE